MSKLVLVARVLLGLIFVVFGVNYFVPFLPQPEPTPAGGAFIGALLESGYLFPFMKTVDVVAGLLLIAGILVPLALVLLAPIVLNIFLYHLFLDPGGMVLALVLLALELFLAWAYRDAWKGVLATRSQPS